MSAFSSSFRRRSKGFALVITLIMVVLAAIIVIAFLSSVSSERFSANSYSKRARAEMAAQSGLAAALSALAGATGPNDFRFITAVGDDGKPVLIPLTTPDATTGAVSLNSSAKRPLYSDSTTSATLTLSTAANAKVTRQAGYIPITDTSNQETERYAFYIDEAGSRQNLATQGPVQSPTPRARAYARDPNELPIVTATAAPSPFNSGQLSALNNQRALLFTPMTVNPLLSVAGASAANPSVDDYSYTAASAMTNLTPDGKPRVDLTKLKAYVDGLSVDQTSGNPRAKLVDRLLGLATPQQTSDWGGGDFSILLKLGRYTQTQCRQIVANLLDYIDSDLIPTTDNVNNPTYFGVEGQAKSDGTAVGHPYINFVGTGLVFNRSSAAGKQGSLNSTRVLVFIGLVNPWSAATKAWETFYIQPEIEIQIGGTASVPPGTLGTQASAYFLSTFSVNNYDNPGDNHLVDYPVSTIAPNTGFLFPHTVGTSSGGQYANFDNLLGNNQQQPPNMTFTNVTFTITRLRLKYTGTDGRSGYVQVLDGLKTINQPMSQSTINMSTGTGALVYRIGTGQTGNTTKTDFHLNGDPRLNFVSQPSPTPNAIWILAKSSPTPAPYPVEPATAPPPQPSPTAAASVFALIDTNNSDFPSPTPSPADTNFSWYTKTNITTNFYVKSPPSDGTAPTLDSAGELGYLHTGIPWETLRFYVAGGEDPKKLRDKELLAYVHSGTFNTADYGTVPFHAPTPAPTPTPTNLISGPINVNTNKRPTLQSLFLGASSKLDSDAAAKANGSPADPDAVSIANALGANASTAPFTLPGDFLALSAVKTITNAQSSDFDREILARRTANILGTQSTRFTVYSLGEARDKLGTSVQTTSTVNLRAEVELQSDSTGKPIPRVLSTAYYLSN